MKTIPKETKWEGKMYRFHSREGCFAIYARPKSAGFLLRRIVLLPYRSPSCYHPVARAEQEQLATDKDRVLFPSAVFSTLEEAQARLRQNVAWEAQFNEEREILRKGGPEARKLRRRMKAEEAAAEQEEREHRQRNPQPVRFLIESIPMPTLEDTRRRAVRADAALLPRHLYLPA